MRISPGLGSTSGTNRVRPVLDAEQRSGVQVLAVKDRASHVVEHPCRRLDRESHRDQLRVVEPEQAHRVGEGWLVVVTAGAAGRRATTTADVLDVDAVRPDALGDPGVHLVAPGEVVPDGHGGSLSSLDDGVSEGRDLVPLRLRPGRIRLRSIWPGRGEPGETR